MFLAFWEVSRVCGTSLGRREVSKDAGRREEGRNLGNRPGFCPGCRAAQVDPMVDLPVGVLGTRGPFSPPSGRFHLGIASKKLRTAMVKICVVKDLHNTNFPAEIPHSSLGTDLVDLQSGSGGSRQDSARSSESLRRVSRLHG